MKALKIILTLLIVYAAVVATFESLLGYFQPANEKTLVITTTDRDRATSSRVVSRLDSGGQLYVAANHWPRAWYRNALQHPEVDVTTGGETGAYVAIPVTGEEHDRVNGEHRLSLGFRVLTGFPPRYLLRLDPR